MDSPPAVSVVIAARDAAPTLERTLTALAAQTIGEPFEVIVVDDGSRDETADIAERHRPMVRLVRNARSGGPGCARNRGVSVAHAPVLAFTDSDCFPTREWLARSLEAIAGSDIIQGAVLPDDSVERTPFDRTVMVEKDRGFYETANLIVRRETFDAVGGFKDWALDARRRSHSSVDHRRQRAGRTPIGEDTLFGWSALRQGARTAFAADAVVHHAVVPGALRDELADRWHWTRDMPGLARLVPELRTEIFYRHWFFHRKTARFDIALIGLGVTLASGRRPWLLAGLPYLDWVARESLRWGAPPRAVRFALGSIAIDLTTLGGLTVGSFAWRSVLL